jgi:uncharacterized protein GlcG (DUF336 family)
MVNDVRKLCEWKMNGNSISVRGTVFQRPDSLHCIQKRSGVDYDPAGIKMEISSRNAGPPKVVAQSKYKPRKQGGSPDMKLTQIVVLAASAAMMTASASAQGLPSQKVVTVDLAQTMAQAAMARCRADGYKVSVLVVDSLNAAKAFVRDDGASASTVEVAKMKATATMLYNRPSGPAQPLPPGTAAPPATLPGTINAQGGVPIKVNDVTIGAIAVSGAPGGDKDAACANAGIAKVVEMLK